MSQGELPAYQRRSRESRRKIVAAFDAALKEKPFDQVSVAEIAERAGVAVGTVYQRFKNKDALIPVTLEIYKDRMEQWLVKDGRIEISESTDLHTALRIVMRQSWAMMEREAHLLRAVHLYARLKPEIAGGDEWRKFEEASLLGLKTLIKHYAADIKRKNINRAIGFATYYFNAIMIEKGLYPDETPGSFYKLSGKAFAEDCADMLYGYLTLDDL